MPAPPMEPTPAQPAGRASGQTGGVYPVNTPWAGIWDRVKSLIFWPWLHSGPRYGRAGKDQAHQGWGGTLGTGRMGAMAQGTLGLPGKWLPEGLLCWRERNLGYLGGISKKEGVSHHDLHGKPNLPKKIVGKLDFCRVRAKLWPPLGPSLLGICLVSHRMQERHNRAMLREKSGTLPPPACCHP